MIGEGAGLDHWRALRGPRPSGSRAAATARDYCGTVLRNAGFAVREQSFDYSHVPGAFATPVAGAVLAAAVTAAWASRHAATAWSPLAAIAQGAVLVGLLAALCAGDGVLTLRAARHVGTNVVATRGHPTPRTWLVAHVDTKWQPVSTLWRTAGIVMLSAAVLLTAGLAVLRLGGHDASAAWTVAVALGWCGGLPVMGSVVGRRGPGALDNATGVAAVLAAAERLPHACDVGVLITDAEELGLAGARAWARAWASEGARGPGIALNCDSVDDAGPLTLMFSGRSAPQEPTGAMRRAADGAHQGAHQGAHHGARLMRLLPGILTDSVALGARGWQTVTLSRGTLRTLSRIHTMADDDAHMTGSGIPAAVQVLVAAATELC